MRILAVILGLALVLLQYRLWLSDQGMREVSAPAGRRSRRKPRRTREQSERNRQLLAEVTDLKVGLDGARGARPQRTRHGRQQRDVLSDRDARRRRLPPRLPPPSPPARSEDRKAARRVWAIVPAAGAASASRREGRCRSPKGRRRSPADGSVSPKQYAPLLRRHRTRMVAARAARASRGCRRWWWCWRRTMRAGRASRRGRDAQDAHHDRRGAIGRIRW